MEQIRLAPQIFFYSHFSFLKNFVKMPIRKLNLFHLFK